MSQQSSNTSCTFPLGIVLFLIFMTLKLAGAITWSWWWVTIPLWGPLALFVVMSILALIAVSVTLIIATILDV